jgi:hypothetical protein
MFGLMKKRITVAALVTLLFSLPLLNAGGYSVATNGGGGWVEGHASGTLSVPPAALASYFGSCISDGYNPPGYAYIYGPFGYAYINSFQSGSMNWQPLAAGNYSYQLDAYGMVYCGIAVRW